MAEPGFDDPGIFFSDPIGSEQAENDESEHRRTADQRRFADFIRNFVDVQNTFKYREQLKRNYNLARFRLEVSLRDVSAFDEKLGERLNKQPTEYLPLFENAAREVADEITKPRPVGEDDIQDIQVTLKSDALVQHIRELRSEHMARLVKVSGVIISASGIRAKATKITLQCRSCRNFLPNITIKPGLEGYAIPRRCPTETAGQPKCPVDSFFIVPDKCKCVDFQVLKLQESPDSVPNGELPRHMQLYVDRYLVDQVVPGNRVTVIGVYSIRKGAVSKGRDQLSVGIRRPYLRVVGISVESEGPGRSSDAPVTPQEEVKFRSLAAQPDVYETIANSIAPSIYGSKDIKKAISALLFGGSRKRLPDGLTRRGDINVLLLGDPGTAKSQLLKFVEKAAPVGVYTSGKGSSAAGLTASVMRDPSSRNFVMEGGAMVLADGGVVCIDEFDKMREDDRVAIHEAMEQQTISIAKVCCWSEC
jgi:DNA replication licensing factor MCM5